MEIPAQRTMERPGPAGPRRPTLIRLYRYMTEWRAQFYGLVTLLLVSLACELALPLVMESAINVISFTDGVRVDFKALTVSIGLFLFIVAISAAAGAAQGRIAAKITLNMARRLRQDAFSGLMNSAVSAFEGMRRGDMMSRMMNDAELAAGAFADSFVELASAMIVIAGSALIMFLKCPSLAAVCVGAGVASILVMGALSRLVFPALTRQQAALGMLNTHVEESLKAFRTCVAGGRTAENVRRMEALSGEYCARRIRASRLEFMLGPVMLALGNLSFMLTVVFGAKSIIAGAITVGAMQAFIMYSRQFMEPLNALGEQFMKVQNALAGAERVFRLIDLKPEGAQIKEAAESAPEGSEEDRYLTFDGVKFAYHKNLPVLKGVTLSLERGERLALVGRTGIGKTTLTNLLMLFYASFDGGIRLEGRDIRRMPPEALRKLFAVVSQEPHVVEGTVLENLLYGCEGAGRADAEALLDDLGVHEMFDRLPRGLDTSVMNGGEDMSQGQLQLICLVRALLRKAEVLILDEATSSMDPDTEDTIKRGMARAMAGRTCLIIAHRLSSVRDADHIAVMADGVIAEYGDHDALMARGGVYRRLYDTQLLGKEI